MLTSNDAKKYGALNKNYLYKFLLRIQKISSNVIIRSLTSFKSANKYPAVLVTA